MSAISDHKARNHSRSDSGSVGSSNSRVSVPESISISARSNLDSSFQSPIFDSSSKSSNKNNEQADFQLMTIDESFDSDDLIEMKHKSGKKKTKTPIESPGSVTSLTSLQTNSKEFDQQSLSSVKSLRPKKKIRKTKPVSEQTESVRQSQPNTDPFYSVSTMDDFDDKKSVKSNKSGKSGKQKKSKLPHPPKYIKENINIDPDIFEFDITKSSTVAVNDYLIERSVGSKGSFPKEKGLLSSDLELDMTGDESNKGTKSFVKSYLGHRKPKNNQKQTKKFNEDNSDLPPTTIEGEEEIGTTKSLRPKKSKNFKNRVDFYSGAGDNDRDSLRTKGSKRRISGNDDEDFDANSELNSRNKLTKPTTDDNNSTLTSKRNKYSQIDDENDQISELKSKSRGRRQTDGNESYTLNTRKGIYYRADDEFDANSDLQSLRRGTRPTADTYDTTLKSRRDSYNRQEENNVDNDLTTRKNSSKLAPNSSQISSNSYLNTRNHPSQDFLAGSELDSRKRFTDSTPNSLYTNARNKKPSLSEISPNSELNSRKQGSLTTPTDSKQNSLYTNANKYNQPDDDLDDDSELKTRGQIARQAPSGDPTTLASRRYKNSKTPESPDTTELNSKLRSQQTRSETENQTLASRYKPASNENDTDNQSIRSHQIAFDADDDASRSTLRSMQQNSATGNFDTLGSLNTIQRSPISSKDGEFVEDLRSLNNRNINRSSDIDNNSLNTLQNTRNKDSINFDAGSELNSRLSSKGKNKYSEPSSLELATKVGSLNRTYQTTDSSLNTKNKQLANIESFDAGSEINSRIGDNKSVSYDYTNSTLHSSMRADHKSVDNSSFELNTQIKSQITPTTEEASTLYTINGSPISKYSEINFDAGSELNSRLHLVGSSKDSYGGSTLASPSQSFSNETDQTIDLRTQQRAVKSFNEPTDDKTLQSVHIENSSSSIDSFDSISFETNPDTDSIHAKKTVFTTDSNKSSLYTFTKYKGDATSLAGSERSIISRQLYNTSDTIGTSDDTLGTVVRSKTTTTSTNIGDTELNSFLVKNSKESDNDSQSLITNAKEDESSNSENKSTSSLNSRRFKEKQNEMERMLSELLESIDTDVDAETKRNSNTVVTDTISVGTYRFARGTSNESSDEKDSMLTKKSSTSSDYEFVSSDSYDSSMETKDKYKPRLRDSTLGSESALMTAISEKSGPRSKSTLTADISVNSRAFDKQSSTKTSSQQINSLLTNTMSTYENSSSSVDEDSPSIVTIRRKKKPSTGSTESINISTVISEKSSLTDSESIDMTINSNRHSKVSSSTKSSSDSTMLTAISSEYSSLSMSEDTDSMVSMKRKKKASTVSSDFEIMTINSSDSDSSNSLSDVGTINSNAFSKSSETKTNTSSRFNSLMTGTTYDEMTSTDSSTQSSIVSLRKRKKKMATPEPSINITTQHDSFMSEKSSASTTNDTINSVNHKSVLSSTKSASAENTLLTNNSSEYDSHSYASNNSSMVSMKGRKKKKRSDTESTLDVTTQHSMWNSNVSSGSSTVDTINSDYHRADSKNETRSRSDIDETLKTGQSSSSYSNSISFDTDSLSSTRGRKRVKKERSESLKDITTNNSLWVSEVSAKDVMSSVPETLNSEGFSKMHSSIATREESVENENSVHSIKARELESSSNSSGIDYSFSLDSTRPGLRKKKVDVPESTISIMTTHSNWNPSTTSTITDEDSRLDTLNSRIEDEPLSQAYTIDSHRSINENKMSSVETETATFDSSDFNSQNRPRRKVDESVDVSNSSIMDDIISKRANRLENKSISETDDVSLTINSKIGESSIETNTSTAPSILERNVYGAESSIAGDSSAFLDSEYRNLNDDSEQPLMMSESESVVSDYRRKAKIHEREILESGSSIPETLASEPLFQSSAWEFESDYVDKQPDKRFEDNYQYKDRTYRYTKSPMEIEYYERIQAQSMKSIKRGIDFFYSDSETLESAASKSSNSSSMFTLMSDVPESMQNGESTVRSIKSTKDNRLPPENHSVTTSEASLTIQSARAHATDSTETAETSVNTDFHKEPFQHNISVSTQDTFTTDHRFDTSVSFGSMIDDIYSKVKYASETRESTANSIVTANPSQEFEITDSSMLGDLNSTRLQPKRKLINANQPSESSVALTAPSFDTITDTSESIKPSVTFNITSKIDESENTETQASQETSISLVSKNPDEIDLKSSQISIRTARSKKDSELLQQNAKERNITVTLDEDLDDTLVSMESTTLDENLISNPVNSSLKTVSEKQFKRQRIPKVEELQKDRTNLFDSDSSSRDQQVKERNIFISSQMSGRSLRGRFNSNTESVLDDDTLLTDQMLPSQLVFRSSMLESDTINIRSTNFKHSISDLTKSINLTTDTFSTTSDVSNLPMESLSTRNSSKRSSKYLTEDESQTLESKLNSSEMFEAPMSSTSAMFSNKYVPKNKFIVSEPETSESNLMTQSFTTETSLADFDSLTSDAPTIKKPKLSSGSDDDELTSKAHTIVSTSSTLQDPSLMSDIKSVQVPKERNISQTNTATTSTKNFSLATESTTVDEFNDELSELHSEVPPVKTKNVQSDLTKSSSSIVSRKDRNISIGSIPEDELTLEEASEREIQSRNLNFANKYSSSASSSSTQKKEVSLRTNSDLFDDDADTLSTSSVKTAASLKKQKINNDDELSTLASMSDSETLSDTNENDLMYSHALETLHSQSALARQALLESSKSKETELTTQTNFETATMDETDNIKTNITQKNAVADSETGTVTLLSDEDKEVSISTTADSIQSKVAPSKANWESDETTTDNNQSKLISQSENQSASSTTTAESIATVKERVLAVADSETGSATFTSEKIKETTETEEGETLQSVVNVNAKNFESSSTSTSQIHSQSETEKSSSTVTESDVHTLVERKKFVADSESNNDTLVSNKDLQTNNSVSVDLKSMISNQSEKLETQTSEALNLASLSNSGYKSESQKLTDINSRLETPKFVADSQTGSETLNTDKFKDDSEDESIDRRSMVSQHRSKYLIESSTSEDDDDIESKSSETKQTSEIVDESDIKTEMKKPSKYAIPDSETGDETFQTRRESNISSSVQVKSISLISQKPRNVANFESSTSEDDDDIKSQTQPSETSVSQTNNDLNTEMDNKSQKPDSQTGSETFTTRNESVVPTTTSIVDDKSIESRKSRFVANFDSSTTDDDNDEIKSQSTEEQTVSQTDRDMTSIMQNNVKADSQTGSESFVTKNETTVTSSSKVENKSLASHVSKYAVNSASSASDADNDEIESKSESYVSVTENDENVETIVDVKNENPDSQTGTESFVTKNETAVATSSTKADNTSIVTQKSRFAPNFESSDEEEDQEMKTRSQTTISLTAHDNDIESHANDQNEHPDSQTGTQSFVTKNETTVASSATKTDNVSIVTQKSRFVPNFESSDDDEEEEMKTKSQTTVSLTARGDDIKSHINNQNEHPDSQTGSMTFRTRDTTKQSTSTKLDSKSMTSRKSKYIVDSDDDTENETMKTQTVTTLSVSQRDDELNSNIKRNKDVPDSQTVTESINTRISNEKIPTTVDDNSIHSRNLTNQQQTNDSDQKLDLESKSESTQEINEKQSEIRTIPQRGNYQDSDIVDTLTTKDPSDNPTTVPENNNKSLASKKSKYDIASDDEEVSGSNLASKSDSDIPVYYSGTNVLVSKLNTTESERSDSQTKSILTKPSESMVLNETSESENTIHSKIQKPVKNFESDNDDEDEMRTKSNSRVNYNQNDDEEEEEYSHKSKFLENDDDENDIVNEETPKNEKSESSTHKKNKYDVKSEESESDSDPGIELYDEEEEEEDVYQNLSTPIKSMNSQTPPQSPKSPTTYEFSDGGVVTITELGDESSMAYESDINHLDHHAQNTVQQTKPVISQATESAKPTNDFAGHKPFESASDD